MWPNKAGDGNSQTTTPGIMSDTLDNDLLSIENDLLTSDYPILDELDRLAKLSKFYNDGHMIKQDWLDRLTLREMHSVIQQEKKSTHYFYMRVEFPEVKCDDRKYHVIYFEEVSMNFLRKLKLIFLFKTNRMLGN